MLKRFSIYQKDKRDPAVVLADSALAVGDSLVLSLGTKEVARFEFSTITAWKGEKRLRRESKQSLSSAIVLPT
jgi:hypothetical protein